MRASPFLVAACVIVLGSAVGIGTAQQYSRGQNRSALLPTALPSSSPSTPAQGVPVRESLIELSTAPLTLVFGGDVMLGRTVETRMKQYGADWPLRQLAPTLKAADITVVNLESPFRSDYASTPVDSLILRGDPQGIANLQVAGVDMVSLANNHITDMGKAGLAETTKVLAQSNIQFAGAGTILEEALKPSIFERKGVRIGFLSYTYGVNFRSPGVEYAVATAERVTEYVQALRSEVDAVVVLCHCGTEYAPQPNAHQKTVAHAAIDAGAALVVGHHPHVPQPVEQYKDGLIVYSLGNLVFDQQEGGNRDRSALAQVTLERGRVTRLDLVPYQIYHYGQPRFVTDLSSKERIWQLFNLPSGTWQRSSQTDQ